jgi:LmbE family N-acetylglucosaminyl deacetylase
MDGDRLLSSDGRTRYAILSPHPGDAIFSAFHVLFRRDPVDVLVIFAGVPPSGTVTALDRAHGATDSAEWVRRRRKEDTAVLGAFGRRPVHLDLLDGQYREAAADADGLTAAIDAALPEEAVLYAPLGVGAQPDHVAVARAALALPTRRRELRLFADSPHYVRGGLPTWIEGGANPEADRRVTAALDAVLPPEREREREVVALSEAAAGRKIALARGYGTEYRFIDEEFAGAASDLELMRHEVFWRVGPAQDGG